MILPDIRKQKLVFPSRSPALAIWGAQPSANRLAATSSRNYDNKRESEITFSRKLLEVPEIFEDSVGTTNKLPVALMENRFLPVNAVCYRRFS